MNTSTPRTAARPAVGRATPTTARKRPRLFHFMIVAIAVAVPSSLLMRTDSRVATTIEFTGSPQTYVVPAGICRLRVDLVGGAGGRGGTAGAPGAGGQAIAVLAVTPRETLRVRVGGWGAEAVGSTPGAGGWNGGGDGGEALGYPDGRPGKAGSGGGGATDVRQGGDGLEHRIIVAAGGSGGAGGGIGGPLGMGGGNGGGLRGADGAAPLGTANAATGGRGATETIGGNPGRNASDLAVTATAGALGVGGDGAPGGASGGGGGGGGLYGGGGGGASAFFNGGHGGGGSGFGPEGTTFQAGVGGGDGRARISYDPDRDGCAGR